MDTHVCKVQVHPSMMNHRQTPQVKHLLFCERLQLFYNRVIQKQFLIFPTESPQLDLGVKTHNLSHFIQLSS